MLRASLQAGLIACLALLGLVNHATTCCCGNSLVLELIVESCACDAHAHDSDNDRHHRGPASREHECYKANSQQFLAGGDPQAVAPPVLALPVDFPPAAVAAGLSVRRPDALVSMPPGEPSIPAGPAVGCWLL